MFLLCSDVLNSFGQLKSHSDQENKVGHLNLFSSHVQMLYQILIKICQPDCDDIVEISNTSGVWWMYQYLWLLVAPETVVWQKSHNSPTPTN